MKRFKDYNSKNKLNEEIDDLGTNPFHTNNIDKIKNGDKVEFIIQKTKRGLKSTNVTLR